MILLDDIKQNIVEEINKTIKKDIVKINDLIYPSKPEFGDLSLPCFVVAKELNKNVIEAAEFLMSKIKINNIIAIKAIGPYLNFVLDKSKLADIVVKEILNEKQNYGLNELGKNKKIMIEYSNANTHKEYHIGHLRNICYGNAVAKILSANGYKIISVSYINDFGIHVAKTLWMLKKNIDLADKEKNKGYFLGKIYTKASQELENNKEEKEKVIEIMKNIESHKGDDYKLWQKTRQWSIDGFVKIYEKLKIKFDNIFYESEYIKNGLDVVVKLYKEFFLIKSDGAIVADLQKFNLGVLLFLRSDGTALYPVADLPLAIEKFNKFKIDKSIFVVDIRQSLYFKQLFKILELLGFKQEMKHLSYEFVKLPDGMMSSRTGNVITFDDLYKQAIKKFVLEIEKRHKDWDEKKINGIAEKIVIGALKFEMIKVNADKIITFNIEQALKYEGYTAVYLQYTIARIQSIIRKSKIKNQELRIILNNFKDIKEEMLICKLVKYSEIIKKAGEKHDPSELTKYLFELAQEFNDFYHAVSILKAEEKIKQSRLFLIMAVKQVLENGLELLGIEIIEEM